VELGTSKYHFGVGIKYHFAHVEPKIPKSSEKGSKRIKAQKLRNARQILDLASPDKIWPRSQKIKKNEGRHPRGACRNSFLVFVSDRINSDSLKISEYFLFS
jgi:hypothetical protein